MKDGWVGALMDGARPKSCFYCDKVCISISQQHVRTPSVLRIDTCSRQYLTEQRAGKKATTEQDLRDGMTEE